MISRNLENLLQTELKTTETHRPVLLIEGARQTGKTTLVQSLLKNKESLFIDLEKQRVFREKIDLCDEFRDFETLLLDEWNFKPGTNKILVIDEAQESTKLGAFVRYMKEDWKNQTVILLGSLMSRLFRDGTREPVGRIKKFIVRPYCFKEYLVAHELNHLSQAIEEWNVEKPFSINRHQLLLKHFQTHLKTGGLPEVVHHHAKGHDWHHLLLQLKLQYEDDFTRVFGHDNLSIYQRILNRVAETTGSLSKKSTIIANNQPGYNKLDDLLSQLEKWHMILKVEHQSYVPTKSGRLSPKRYLFDLGLAQLLALKTRPEINLLESSSALDRTPLGGIIENAVLCELKTNQKNLLSGWRHKVNGAEIDFVLKNETITIPIEVKANAKLNQHVIRSLHTYQSLYKNSQLGVLVNLGKGGVVLENKNKILCVPIYCVSEIPRLVQEHSC